MTETPRKKPQRRQSGRIAFIACSDRVRAQLDRGVTMIAIYDMYAAQLGMSYAQFTRYVNAEIRGKPPKRRGKRNALAAGRGWPDMAAGLWPREPHGHVATSSLGADDPAVRRPRGLGRRELPEFHYDPMDAYRKRRQDE